ncbi:glutathione S-transferase N-terminal domain-containing protein [Novosphingobium lentum]|uniref:glutathione S-transferase N-terminal domain-containing protein n=1 Tax=Novosphingobium lentum TaxID=145287 RepID=UPI000832D454|nr:glutathione S-transferase N-terminal domain-containing protein [Novosphingobium lentum]
MITLYAWPTPNGQKLFLMLEELGEPYKTHFVHIGRDEQFDPAFLAISPNNKIPAIVDDAADGGPLAMFESGAILTYLADKAGRFLAPTGAARWQAMQWLHWQIGGLGPMLGQLGFYGLRSEEKASLPIRRFSEEATRLIGVLNRRLGEARFLAGDDYSIADIAIYPWMKAASANFVPLIGEALAASSNVARWLDEVGARPAVIAAMAIKPPA